MISKINFYYQFAKHGIYQGSVSIFDRITFVLIFISVARYLGGSELGKLSTSLNYFTIINLISTLGLNVVLHRESSNSSNINTLLKNILTIKIFLSSILLLSIIPFSVLSDDISVYYLLVLYFGILFYDLSSMLLTIQLGRNQSQLFFITQFISRVILLSLVICTIFIGDNSLIPFCFVISGSVQLFITLKINSNELRQHSILSFEWNALKSVIRKSFPIWLGLVFVTLYDKFDLILINSVVGSGEAGVYYAGYSTMKGTMIFGAFYLNYYFTSLSKHFKNGLKEDFLNSMKNSLSISIIIGITTAFVIYFLSDEIIHFLYGKEFTRSSIILKILCFATPLILLNYNLGVISNSIIKPKYPMYAGGVALVSNITLNLIFIPIYGILASAYITLITELTMFVFLIVPVSKAVITIYK